MADVAHCDYETRSAVDLRKTGAYRYAEDPTTGVWVLCWRLNDGPIQRWHPGGPDPQPLLDHVRRGGTFKAHNVNFERQIWNVCVRSRLPHWPRLEIAQCDCTMARALAVHLPADLDDLGSVLDLPIKKDREGAALMGKMSRPRKIHADGTIAWWDESPLVLRLGDYCHVDVMVESEADKKLPQLSADERALCELDQRINDRGVTIDVASVERAIAVLDAAGERANDRLRRLTGGSVEKFTQGLRLADWLRERGIPCDSIAKSEHDDLLTMCDLFGDKIAREVVELRAEYGRSSVAKFRRMLDMVCSDGRVRGLFSYHRASTGRFGGSGVQPHNLARFEDATADYLPAVLAAIEIMEAA